MDAKLDRDASHVGEVWRSAYPAMLIKGPSSGLALEAVLSLVGPCYLLFFSVLWAIGESHSLSQLRARNNGLLAFQPSKLRGVFKPNRRDVQILPVRLCNPSL